MYHIPESIARNWIVNEGDVLKSHLRYSRGVVGRISYHAGSGELLIDRDGSSHASTIHNHGTHLFDEYVRAVYIPKTNTVYIRGTSDSDGFDKQYDLVEDLGLEGLGYEIHYNLDNKALRAISCFV